MDHSGGDLKVDDDSNHAGVIGRIKKWHHKTFAGPVKREQWVHVIIL